MRLMPLLLLLFLPTVASPFQQKTVTLYLDGAKVEVLEKARQGYLEVALPDELIPGSLRVVPLDGGVRRVEVAQRGSGGPVRGERGRLKRRRAEVEDRLKALAVREEVFTAAARSQSGKSLRKTKNNPDPLGALRQGTEFALGQLEGIYRSRRKLEAELGEIDRQLSAAPPSVQVARVWLTGRGARLSWLTRGERWRPAYSIRVGEASVGEILLHARLPRREKGVRLLVAPGPLAAAPAPSELAGEFPTLSRRRLVLQKEEYTELPYPTLALSFSGGEPWWPPGEMAAFRDGSYLGSAPFPGGSAGELAFGK